MKAMCLTLVQLLRAVQKANLITQLTAALTPPPLRIAKQQITLAQAILVPLQAVTLPSYRVDSLHHQGIQVYHVLIQPSPQRIYHHHPTQLTTV